MWDRLRHNQPAQIAVITPLAIIALIGVMGLVIDIGLFRVIDSELENAADAAALAAAWYDPVCPYPDPRCAADNAPSTAVGVAQRFADYNTGLAQALCGSPIARLTPDSVPVHQIQSPKTNGVTVILQCRAGYLAGRVLGLGSTEITRWGTAAIGEESDVIADGTTHRTMGAYVDRGGASIPPLIAGLAPL